MNTDIFQKIIEDHKELSSLPQTLAEVLKVIKDEKSSAQDLAKVLSCDPAMTAKILRIVNSPFYGASREITTLTQAVVTLGTRAVSALALSTSVYDLTGKWQTSIDRIRFWRHSLEVAIASRLIAEAVRYPRLEEAFISGLLHDIGLLVLEKSFKDKFQTIWKKAEWGEYIVEIEENTWGTNHARIGQFLLEQWNIPSSICEAVGVHHNTYPPDIDDPESCLNQIVILANKLSKFTIVKNRVAHTIDADNKEILRKNLKLAPELLKSIEENLFNHTIEQAKFLEVNIGSTEEILIEANKMLYRQYNTVENLLLENSTMQKEIARGKMEKAALQALRTITATFNHYLNNAAATILGRAQLIEVALQKGDVIDTKDKASYAVEIIINGVNTIQLVLEELKNLSAFKTTVYHDDTYIIDIEKKIKLQLEELDKKNKMQPIS